MAKDQKRFTLEITFTVDSTADEHVQTPLAISDEARSWLESLRVIVQRIEITKDE